MASPAQQIPLREVYEAGLAWRQRHTEPGEDRKLNPEQLRLLVKAFVQGVQGDQFSPNPHPDHGVPNPREVEKEIAKARRPR